MLALRRVLGTYLLSRLAVLVTAVMLMLAGGLGLTQVLARWDGAFYLAIVRHGYPASVPVGTGPEAQSPIAFFPGYPLLVRIGSLDGRVSPTLVGIALSLAAGAVAVAALWELARRLTDEANADRTVLLYCFLPPAFVLTMVYADALYLALTIVCLLLLLDRRWLGAGAAAMAAGAVRPNAAVLTLTCAWAAIAAIRASRDWRALVAPVLAPLGALAYLGYLAARTGEPRAFFLVQERGWDNRIDLGAANLARVAEAVTGDKAVLMTVAIVGALAATAFAVVLFVGSRPPSVLVVYTVGVVALAVFASNPVSLPRFLLAAFPLLIPVARWLPPGSVPAIAAVSATLMGGMFAVTTLTETLSP